MHDFFETHTKDFILIRHLLAQVGDEAASTALALFRFLNGAIYIILDAFKRRYFGIGESLVQLLYVVFVKSVDDGETKVLFARKIVVKRALWHVAGSQDFIDARGVVALFEHDVDARLYEQAFGVLFG